MADKIHTNSSPDPSALSLRLMSILPRLTLAIWRAGYRQTREVTGLDYSLIDYQGVFSAANRFALVWWLEPLRAFAAQAELYARVQTLIERQYRRDDAAETKTKSAADKRFADKAWSEDPQLRLVKELYLLYRDWLMAQIHACPALS